MRSKLVQRVVAAAATGVLTLGLLAGCGNGAGGGSDANQGGGGAGTQAAGGDEQQQGGDEQQGGGNEAGGELESLLENPVTGKILYLSNISSGAQYDYYTTAFQNICEKLGYSFEVVLGDGFNDPDGNLTQVRNAYTSDVVGLIAVQDGGIANIMEEYPELYVVGFNSDMASVFNEDGASHAALSNDHFIGDMCDMYISGVDNGADYAESVIAAGYKKVAVVTFPPFAYPQHTVADATFREKIAEYNATADEPIEIVGDATVLQFAPLEDSYFMEEGHGDLDAIIGICAGTQFIYPTMVAAKANGTCDAKTKLLTGGFENNQDLFNDAIAGQTLAVDKCAMPETYLWPIIMLDNAIQGIQFADYTETVREDGAVLSIDSPEDFQAIIDNCPYWDNDQSKNVYSWADIQQMMPRYNADATYANLLQKTTKDLTMDCYLK